MREKEIKRGWGEGVEDIFWKLRKGWVEKGVDKEIIGGKEREGDELGKNERIEEDRREWKKRIEKGFEWKLREGKIVWKIKNEEGVNKEKGKILKIGWNVKEIGLGEDNREG